MTTTNRATLKATIDSIDRLLPMFKRLRAKAYCANDGIEWEHYRDKVVSLEHTRANLWVSLGQLPL